MWIVFSPSSFVNSLNNDVKIVASKILDSVIVVSSIAHHTLILRSFMLLDEWHGDFWVRVCVMLAICICTLKIKFAGLLALCLTIASC